MPNQRFQIMSGGNVLNTIILNTDEWTPEAYAAHLPPGQTIRPEEELPPTPLPVPEEVPAWRIKAVAKLAGIEPAINAALASLTEPNRTVATLAWAEGNVIRRDSATVQQLAAALGLTSEQMDDFFRQADSLAV